MHLSGHIIYLSIHASHNPCFQLDFLIDLEHFCSVVKSRLQAGQAHALRYKSSLDGLITIINEEGIEGLYRGIGSKLTQSVLTAAILFACQRRIYEITKAVCLLFSVLFESLTDSFPYRQSMSQRSETSEASSD